MPLASITDIRRCVIDLSAHTASSEQPLASLSLKNIRDSLIVCGRVDGPAHVTDVKRCTVVVACRQFRLHDSVDVDVYLSCRTRPVIEYSSGLRFAPAAEIFVSCALQTFHRLFTCSGMVLLSQRTRTERLPISSLARPEVYSSKVLTFNSVRLQKAKESRSEQEQEQSHDQWDQVDDFNHLRPSTQGPDSQTEEEENQRQEQNQSPNWSILPVEKRLPVSVFMDLDRQERSEAKERGREKQDMGGEEEGHDIDEEQEKLRQKGDASGDDVRDDEEDKRKEKKAEEEREEQEEQEEREVVERILARTVPRLNSLP